MPLDTDTPSTNSPAPSVRSESMSTKWEPVAPRSSQIVGPNYRLTILTPSLLRYEWSPDGEFEDRASTFAVHRAFPTPKIEVYPRGDGGLDIHTDKMHIDYDGKEFSPNGLIVNLKLGSIRDEAADVGGVWGKTWRYGVKKGNLGGTCRTLDEADGRVPLEDGVCSLEGFAVIDDTNSMLFTDDNWVASRIPYRTDGYLFAYGFDYRAAIKALTTLSGKQPVLPRWTLGNWWSRYYPYTADEYLALMDRFNDEGIPMSVSVLDMDWHLTTIPEEYGAPWTGYTWDEKLFPDHVAFLQKLHDRSLKVTLNTHPADGIRAFEKPYENMCKALGRDPGKKHPITFDCTDRDFLEAYFTQVHHPIEDEGVDFWWLDWQQGRHSKIPNVDPLWMLNHFHYIDSRRHGRRIAFSRYAGPGSHRYPIGFSGDTQITWASLDFQPEMTASAANIGFGWWSHDIGGHFHGSKDDELLTRWTQLGCFSPILRLHSSNNIFNTREPWKQNTEARKIMTDFMQLRARLVPYIYSEGVRCTVDSRSLVEPMYYEYPHVADAYKYRNSFAFGSQMIVAPITAPRKRTTMLGKTTAWIPKGRWVDYFTSVVYEGGRAMALHRPLDKMPVLIKEGGIVVLDKGTLQNGCPLPEKLEIVLVVGQDGSFELIEDDGQGSGIDSINFARTVITYDQASGALTIGPTSQALVPAREWTLRLLAFRPTGEMTAQAGDAALQPRAEVRSGFTRIHLGSVPASETIIVTLGPNPQLSKNDVNGSVEQALERMQIGYEIKPEVWAIVKSGAGLNVIMSRLSAVGNLDDDVRGAVVELILADSRV